MFLVGLSSLSSTVLCYTTARQPWHHLAAAAATADSRTPPRSRGRTFALHGTTSNGDEDDITTTSAGGSDTDRKMPWPLNMFNAPVVLDGTLAGDAGFDPLGLARSKDDLFFYREAEVKHARIAMLVGRVACNYDLQSPLASPYLSSSSVPSPSSSCTGISRVAFIGAVPLPDISVGGPRGHTSGGGSCSQCTQWCGEAVLMHCSLKYHHYHNHYHHHHHNYHHDDHDRRTGQCLRSVCVGSVLRSGVGAGGGDGSYPKGGPRGAEELLRHVEGRR